MSDQQHPPTRSSQFPRVSFSIFSVFFSSCDICFNPTLKQYFNRFFFRGCFSSSFPRLFLVFDARSVHHNGPSVHKNHPRKEFKCCSKSSINPHNHQLIRSWPIIPFSTRSALVPGFLPWLSVHPLGLCIQHNIPSVEENPSVIVIRWLSVSWVEVKQRKLPLKKKKEQTKK